MKASTKRVVSILLTLLLFIATLVFYTYLLKPAYLEVRNQRAEIASRLNLINEHERVLSKIQALLKEYQNTAQFNNTISSILPIGPNSASAVNQIVTLAKLNRLGIFTLKVQQLAIKPSSQPTLVKGIGTLRFTLKLGGSYESFKSFLQNLETNINLMDVVDLKIEPSTAGATDFLYTITIDTYYQAE